MECTRLVEDRSDDWIGRADAAFALGQFAFYSGKRREEIVRTLVRVLGEDPDPAVQAACYEQLLHLLAPERDVPVFDDDFDRRRDVDWSLLQPYLDN